MSIVVKSMRTTERAWPSGGKVLLLIWALSGATALHAQVSASLCGPLTSSFGPFDYRSNKVELDLVERFHFTMEVEQLIRGKNGHIGGDLNYTLHAFPNHHRALLALMKYGERLKTPRVPYTAYDVECYFIRATNFKRDDTTARMLYAVYLKAKGRRDEALRQLDIAAGYASDNPFTHYNLGLSYLELNAFEKARQFARSALDLGFPSPQLKERLVAAGQWEDSTDQPDSGAAAEPAASAASR